jgi:hypothetical protein
MLRDEQAEEGQGRDGDIDTIAGECPVSEWKGACRGLGTRVVS